MTFYILDVLQSVTVILWMFTLYFRLVVLQSPSSLCLPHDGPVKPRDKVVRQGRDFNPGAGRLSRWQASASK